MDEDLLTKYDPTKPPTVEAAVRLGKAEILADVANRRVPLDVSGFAELHDYVDANEYAGFCTDEFSAAARLLPSRPGDEDHDRDNHLTMALIRFASEVQDELDQWIKDGGVRAEVLRRHLSVNYATLQFDVVPKKGLGHEEDKDAPGLLVVFSAGEADPAIVDPLSSSCSRFPVNPEEAYGLSLIDATLIRQHNRIAFTIADCEQPLHEPLSGDTLSILDRVKGAMQEAEKLWGPTRWEYVALMGAIASEAAQRAANCRLTMKGSRHG